MSTPTKATAAPITSKRSGVLPSISQPHQHGTHKKHTGVGGVDTAVAGIGLQRLDGRIAEVLPRPSRASGQGP